jgi:hypothetical protein
MRQEMPVVGEIDAGRNLHFFRDLPMGVALWQLHDPRDVRSLRFLGVNPAGERELRAPVGFALGKLIADCFPKLLETQVPESCRRVALSGKPDTIGEVAYRDSHIPAGVFWMDCFPLPQRCVGLALENITERKSTIDNQSRALQLLHRIALFLNKASDALEAAQFCVHEICKQIGWPVGRFFLSDEASPSRFLPNPVWHFSDAHRFEAFRKATELYERDLTNKLALEYRVTQGRRAGLAKSVGFSVVEKDCLRGVLEFSSDTLAPLDEHAFRAISNVGIQLGQVFARERFGRECCRIQVLMRDSHHSSVREVLVAGNAMRCAVRGVRAVRKNLLQDRANLSRGLLEATRRLTSTLEESKRLIAKPTEPPSAVASLRAF